MRRLIERARTTGSWPAFRSTLNSMLPPSVFRRADLVIEKLDLSHVDRTPDRDPVAVRWAGPEDVPLLARVRPVTRRFAGFFAAGHLCALGELGGVPVSFTWIEVSPRHVSRPNGYAFELDARSCWVFACEVAEAHRSKGVYRRHWAALVPLLHARGLDTAYLAIHDANEVSLKAHARIGFTPVARVRVVRTLGLTRHRVCAPYEAAETRGWGPWSGRDAVTIRSRGNRTSASPSRPRP